MLAQIETDCVSIIEYYWNSVHKLPTDGPSELKIAKVLTCCFKGCPLRHC